MQVLATELPGVLLIEPDVVEEERGFFLETFHEQRYREIGLTLPFVQDNRSLSRRGVLRGLHYQDPHPQGKLVWVIRGEIYDVAVDLRKRSPTFRRWVSVRLNARRCRQLYIPPGLAHGFCTLSRLAEVTYKTTDYYHPDCEWAIRWDDPELAIDWPIAKPLLSDRDRCALPLAEAHVFE